MQKNIDGLCLVIMHIGLSFTTVLNYLISVILNLHGKFVFLRCKALLPIHCCSSSFLGLRLMTWKWWLFKYIISLSLSGGNEIKSVLAWTFMKGVMEIPVIIGLVCLNQSSMFKLNCKVWLCIYQGVNFSANDLGGPHA